jgi:signal transduction histidine kinase
MRYLLLLLLVFPAILYGQNAPKDTKTISPNAEQFNRYNTITSPTEADIKAIIELFNAYSLKNEDTTILLGNKALKWSQELKNKPLEGETLQHFGYAYGAFGQYKKGEKFIKESIAIFEKLKDETGINISNNKLGNLAMRQNNLEDALDYFLKVLDGWGDLKSENLSVEPYLNTAWIYFNMSELGKVHQYVEEANKVANHLGDKRSKMLVKSKEGTILMYLSGQFKEFVRKDTIPNAATQDSAALFMEQSIIAYEMALELAKELEDDENMISILNNMVVFYSRNGDQQKSFEKAKEAEQLAKNYGDMDLYIQSKYNLAFVSLELKRFKDAEKYGKESLALSQKYGLKRKEALSNSALVEVYRAMGDFENALFYIEERYIYEQEIGNVERQKALAEVEAQFQTVKKEKQILELETRNSKIQRQRNYLIIGGLLASLFGFILFQFNKVRKERNDKKIFTEALLAAQEAERKRIARDLHDGIGQSLLMLKKEMVANQAVSLENQSMISATLDEVRSISRDLHPLQLEKFGLTAAIEDTIQKIAHSTGLFITSEIINVDTAFAKKSEIHIYRAIQEALNNVIKHANATAARVTIEVTANQYIIQVMDNGQGFDHEVAVAKSKSLGLRTMYERVESIGGQLKIQPNEPNGTIIKFIVPKI